MVRIYEIEVPTRQVVATDRFVKEFEDIKRGYPEAAKNLQIFIEKRKSTDIGTSTGKKDYPIQGSALQGYPHTHIVYGKVVLIYDVTSGQLRLITIGSHKMVDKITKSLSDWVLNLGGGDFKPFSVGNGQSKPVINNYEKEKLVDMFWDFAADPTGRDNLIAAVNGTWTDDTKEYMLMNIDQKLTTDQKWEAILQGFGGELQIIDQIKMILKNTQNNLTAK